MSLNCNIIRVNTISVRGSEVLASKENRFQLRKILFPCCVNPMNPHASIFVLSDTLSTPGENNVTISTESSLIQPLLKMSLNVMKT